MSPRPYQVGTRRRLATEATRSRIIDAARELLADPRASSFSIDGVAERADVARMTVYYQFKSKAKLLEALFDDFSSRANMQDLRKAFQEPNPGRSLEILIEVFCHLWETQRALVRRLYALAALDPEVEKALIERNSWRIEALTKIVGRTHRGQHAHDLVDLLHVLTSFETYDALAQAHRPPKKIAELLQKAAAAIFTTVSS
jgi:AcrR family transcriptional regulator